MPKVTIFTIPKPFVGHIGVIQENAIRSWLTVSSENNVVIFGDELGSVDYAAKLGVRHLLDIARSIHNTPLLNDVFKKAHGVTTTDFLCYVNCDIVFNHDIITALERVQNIFDRFLIVGRRVDLDVSKPINFSDGWEEQLWNYAREKGRLHGYSGIDYFLFSRSMYHEIPPFAVGRVGWDNWMIYHAIHLGIPVIDITPSFLPIHQNHDYSHLNDGVRQRDSGEEANLNLRFAGGRKNMYSIRDATHQLTRNKIEKRKDIYRIYRCLVTNTGLHWLLSPFIALRRMILRLIG